jgi:hypothetical protein
MQENKEALLQAPGLPESNSGVSENDSSAQGNFLRSTTTLIKQQE